MHVHMEAGVNEVNQSPVFGVVDVPTIPLMDRKSNAKSMACGCRRKAVCCMKTFAKIQRSAISMQGHVEDPPLAILRDDDYDFNTQEVSLWNP